MKQNIIALHQFTILMGTSVRGIISVWFPNNVSLWTQRQDFVMSCFFTASSPFILLLGVSQVAPSRWSVTLLGQIHDCLKRCYYWTLAFNIPEAQCDNPQSSVLFNLLHNINIIICCFKCYIYIYTYISM